MGDALVNLDPVGLSVLPAKYCTDPVGLTGALQALVGLRFDTVTFAHGLPLVTNAAAKVSALLAGFEK
jgi:hypothetical protein